MKIKPQHIVIGVALVAILAFLLPQVLANQPGARSEQDGVITETINVTEAHEESCFTVTLIEGAGAEHESIHIFEALAGLPGVGDASFDTQTLELVVAYDARVIDGLPIRERLVNSGYLVPTAADATAAELSEDGTMQSIQVSDDGVGFDPFLIRLAAGIPTEITFTPGQECRTVVKFPALGIQQDIALGGVVNLPAMEPGEYPILCSGDGNEGTLIVE